MNMHIDDVTQPACRQMHCDKVGARNSGGGARFKGGFHLEMKYESGCEK